MLKAPSRRMLGRRLPSAREAHHFLSLWYCCPSDCETTRNHKLLVKELRCRAGPLTSAVALFWLGLWDSEERRGHREGGREARTGLGGSSLWGAASEDPIAAQGYGTVRDIEDTEKESEKPVQGCLIADCGELPQDTDLASIPTFIAEVWPAVLLLMPAHYNSMC